MSPIFVIAPFLAFLVSIGIWGTLRVADRWFGNPGRKRVSGSAAALLAFPVLTVLIFVWLPRAATSTGIGVTARAANDQLLTFSVPETATDVSFRPSYYSGRIDQADFAIGETAFLEWMKQNQWTPIEFHTDADGIHWHSDASSKRLDEVWVTPVATVREGHNEDLQVRNGYYFDDYDQDDLDDSGLTVVYDKDRSRAHVWRTTF